MCSDQPRWLQTAGISVSVGVACSMYPSLVVLEVRTHSAEAVHACTGLQTKYVGKVKQCCLPASGCGCGMLLYPSLVELEVRAPSTKAVPQFCACLYNCAAVLWACLYSLRKEGVRRLKQCCCLPLAEQHGLACTMLARDLQFQ